MSIISDGNKKTDALDGRLTFEQTSNRIVGKDENNLIRLLILGDGSNFVMKISKDGFSALDADDENLIFNSGQNIFKIIDKVSITTSTYSISGTANQWKSFNNASPDSYEHNLGYIPIVLAFIEVTTGQRVLMPYTFASTPTTSQALFTQVSVNATDQYLYFTDLSRVFGDYSGTAGGNAITAYMLQESAI